MPACGTGGVQEGSDGHGSAADRSRAHRVPLLAALFCRLILAALAGPAVEQIEGFLLAAVSELVLESCGDLDPLRVAHVGVEGGQRLLGDLQRDLLHRRAQEVEVVQCRVDGGPGGGLAVLHVLDVADVEGGAVAVVEDERMLGVRVLVEEDCRQKHRLDRDQRLFRRHNAEGARNGRNRLFVKVNRDLFSVDDKAEAWLLRRVVRRRVDSKPPREQPLKHSEVGQDRFRVFRLSWNLWRVNIKEYQVAVESVSGLPRTGAGLERAGDEVPFLFCFVALGLWERQKLSAGPVDLGGE